MGFTISVSQDKHMAVAHDYRVVMPDNADERLTKNNKIIVGSGELNESLLFNEFFEDSVEEYNGKQKRKDRRVNNYYENIAEGKGKEHPFYEYVIQIGNRDTNGTFDHSEEAMKAREALDKAASRLQDKYPSFHFWFIGSHADEPNGTYHYHVRFTPVGEGYKNGMKKRCSLNKALENMGFKQNGYSHPINEWKKDVESLIEEEMRSLGLERAYGDGRKVRTETKEFVSAKQIESAIEMIEQSEKLAEETSAIYSDTLAFKKNEEEKAKKTEIRLEDKEKFLHSREDELNQKARSINLQRKALEDKRDELEEWKENYKKDVEAFKEDYKKKADKFYEDKWKKRYEQKMEELSRKFDNALKELKAYVKEITKSWSMKNRTDMAKEISRNIPDFLPEDYIAPDGSDKTPAD